MVRLTQSKAKKGGIKSEIESSPPNAVALNSNGLTSHIETMEGITRKGKTYIELLLTLGEAVAGTAVYEENDGVDVGEILLPDLAGYVY